MPVATAQSLCCRRHWHWFWLPQACFCCSADDEGFPTSVSQENSAAYDLILTIREKNHADEQTRLCGKPRRRSRRFADPHARLGHSSSIHQSPQRRAGARVVCGRLVLVGSNPSIATSGT